MASLLNGWPGGALSDLATWITKQYDLQSRHPERGALYQGYAQLSQTLRDTRPWESLRYGPAERCVIDFFAADANGRPTPLFVFVHGGFWRGGEPTNFHAIAKGLLGQGISAAFIGYELTPSVTLTELYQQVRAGMQFLLDSADSLGFDLKRISLCGHSAGGHLVAMLASENAAAWPHEPFANVIPISGIFALEPMLLSPINHLCRITPQEVHSHSPLLKTAFHAKRFSVLVGEGETESFLLQSEVFHKHLRALGQVSELYRIAGHHHFSIFKIFLDPSEPLLGALIRRMRDPDQT
ncbi:MAG TPA: alpha/beta hydrolase [Burkholderiaceae bacterium]